MKYLNTKGDVFDSFVESVVSNMETILDKIDDSSNDTKPRKTSNKKKSNNGKSSNKNSNQKLIKPQYDSEPSPAIVSFKLNFENRIIEMYDSNNNLLASSKLNRNIESCIDALDLLEAKSKFYRR